ncbi:MAG: DUF885 domain-containing protein [Gammaproteobacteria bacterium]
MKKALKILGGLVAAVFLLAALAVAQAWFFRPFSIDIFFEKAFLRAVIDDPETLSYLRLLEPMGIDFHNDDLSDVSVARQKELAAQLRGSLEDLRRYDRASLSEQRKISYDVLDWFLQNQADGERWMFHDYPVNQLFGIQSQLPDFMINTHQVNDAETARDYVARLGKFKWKFDQVLEGLRLRESLGVIPPRFTVTKVLDQMRAFAAPAPNEQVLYTNLRDALGKLESVPQAERDAILADGEKAIAESVLPAYRELIAYFEALQAKATANNGVWALPDGEAYYAWCVRNHTTADYNPEQLHQLGLDEVARIEAQMEAILKAQGVPKAGSIGERLTRLSRDPRYLYPDTDEGRAQILADYQKIIDEISGGLDGAFDLKPKVGVKVERVPPFMEKSTAGAYYQQPAMDGSRPGKFFANLRDVNSIYKWGMRTLAYHEGVPGHHFQIAIALELKGVPTFRRLGLFTAYAEGWALYAERLAWELGFQKEPMDDLGRLQDEMLRAVRLVVDTGMHARRWTREQAIEYMLAKTGQPEVDVVAEIERYLVAPGQALAYKAGMLKILELREKLKQRQGADFDLRKFHNVVLVNGAVPLPVLDKLVMGGS